jgi:hypothetical protein
MLSLGIINVSHVAGLLSLIDGVTSAIDVQVAKNKGDHEQEIVIISQLHLVNVQQLRDLDYLAVRWGTTDICSICKEEYESILIKMEMMQKMRTPVPHGGFPLTNLKFKTWLHLKMLIKMETPLTNSSCPPPVDCNGQEIDMSAFSIRQAHSDDLRIVCPLFERSLLPHIDCVIDHHEHMFMMHNIAHLFCKGHLDDILALLLFHHLKLATLKEDNTDVILGLFYCCFTIIDVKIIVDKCMFKL